MQGNLPLDSGRKHTAMVFVETRPDLFRDDFKDWVKDNFHVYEAFEREANRVWNRGYKHHSARDITAYLRHNTLVAENGGEFKINNNVSPDLGRLYALFHPEREGFFERRVGVSARRAA